MPSSVAKMKMAEPLVVPSVMLNEPAGVHHHAGRRRRDRSQPAGGGIVTKGSPVFTLPALSKSDEVPRRYCHPRNRQGWARRGPKD